MMQKKIKIHETAKEETWRRINKSNRPPGGHYSKSQTKIYAERLVAKAKKLKFNAPTSKAKVTFPLKMLFIFQFKLPLKKNWMPLKCVVII